MVLNANFDTPLDPDRSLPGAVEQRGGLAISRDPPGDGTCDRLIMLTDRTIIQIRADDPPDRPAPVDLCDVAEAGAVAILSRDGLGDRAPTPAGLVDRGGRLRPARRLGPVPRTTTPGWAGPRLRSMGHADEEEVARWPHR